MMSSRIGLVRCEHCGRQFNPHSAARHIPWCAKQQSAQARNRPSQEKREALERYKWRIGYRPSNSNLQTQPHSQANQQQLQQRRRPPLAKKSSTNSSATLSSPSASSSASLAGRSTISSRQHQRSRQQPAQVGQLQRSISSLTLTKQAGVVVPMEDLEPPRLSGSKSVSDLVAGLARRVEEIYVQNQALLAGISLGNLNKGANSDEDEDEEMFRCHHCKSACLPAANYCHRCGCRLPPTLDATSFERVVVAAASASAGSPG